METYTTAVRFLTVHLLAMWIAMCCCQWRAVASSLGMKAMPSCCETAEPASDCCSDRTGSEDSTPEDPTEGGSCAGCCNKGPAPSAQDLPDSLFEFHLDHLGTMLLHMPSIALPSVDPSIELGTVWHPPPGRFRPIICILTV
ncbi:MAG: hypothetical protein FJ270_00645 [Planctomycetes bacterium]|nr:hypothetical protein [Planctomycetota bacterium]